MLRDFILNFKRTAGLESISDEIQIRAIINFGYLLCSPVGACNVFRPTECLLFELIIYNHANLLKNYLVLLKNLREKNSLLFVMHVFFVGAALLTLLLVLLSSGLRLLV